MTPRAVGSARALAGGVVSACLLAGCAGGEADAVCAAERLPDDVDAGVLTIGTMLPGAEGDVHVVARWPDRAADPASWPVAVVVHGAWTAAGTPIAEATPRPDLTDGLVDVHLDLPGGGETGGPDDHRGELGRAAVAAALRWAAGELRDRGGCTLGERVPGADPDTLFVLGTSNGGNLATATLADTTLDVPEVAGLVVWETPAGPQFANVELGVDPTVYTPGTCTFAAATGIACPVPAEELVAGTVDGADVLCFDRDGDAACGARDVVVRGTRTGDGRVYVSPLLARAAADRGVLPASFAPADEADAWWEERDAARLAEALVAARPALPVMLLASEADHVQSLPDHPHVFGLGEALQRAGAAWVRLNPGAEWLAANESPNAPNVPLTLENPSANLLSEEAEGPTARLFAAALFELTDRRSSGDW